MNPNPARCNQKWRMKCSQWKTDGQVSQQNRFTDTTNFKAREALAGRIVVNGLKPAKPLPNWVHEIPV
jgi:carotenoid cleavage dioxygenase-like enzyme